MGKRVIVLKVISKTENKMKTMTSIKNYTDLEQSKKLDEILSLESADMYYTGHQSIIDPKEREYGDTPNIRGKYISFDDKRIFRPCWSLTALLSVLPNYELINSGDTIQLAVNREALETEGNETLIDLVVNMIMHLHELKECSDERIRKALIRFHKSTIDIDGIKGNEIVTWLEKQGEQKPQGKTALEAINEEKVDNANKVEQKPTEWSEEYIADVFEKVGLAKIVREQSNDALTIALQDAMIELSKVTLQPKPTAWSEEDEEILRTIISDGIRGAEIDILQIDWLKSIKNRYAWKPSDEQMKTLNEVLNFAANHESPHWNDYIFGTLNNLIRQLKKLKE